MICAIWDTTSGDKNQQAARVQPALRVNKIMRHTLAPDTAVHSRVKVDDSYSSISTWAPLRTDSSPALVCC